MFIFSVLILLNVGLMDMRFISGYNVYTSTLFTNVSTNPQPEFLETTSDLFTLHQRHIINV